jgi:hypothetical protein
MSDKEFAKEIESNLYVEDITDAIEAIVAERHKH